MSSFDGIANKFDSNIYGTTKGRIRHELLCFYLNRFLDAATLNVADLGGGTGMMSREFAQRNHQVLLTDLSADVIEIAKERLADYNNVEIRQQSIVESLADNCFKTVDLILCHAVLEWLDSPLSVVSSLIENARPGSYLSISFFNHDANLFGNALYGNFDYIDKGLKVKNQVRLNPKNPLRPQEVLAHIQANDNATIVHDAGLRCFHDYMFDRDRVDERYDGILHLEKQLGATHPYKYLGKYYHCIVRKL